MHDEDNYLESVQYIELCGGKAKRWTIVVSSEDSWPTIGMAPSDAENLEASSLVDAGVRVQPGKVS